MNKNDKQIAKWLLTGCILVALMLILGSITRLTESGLSMVTWKPVVGMVPPLSDADWQMEFSNYQNSPEYIKKNYHFTLEEFKSIFYWEYSHRLFGRIIGIVFLIPFLFFVIKKKIKSKSLMYHLIVIFFLGGLQGVIGWYMVKSGLKEHPHVSHYWLAFHLVTALFLISYIYVTALNLLFPKQNDWSNTTQKVRKSLNVLLILASLQITYGAFVAGLKAGKFYTTFPKMGTEWLPDLISDAFKEKGMLALIENPIVIQFIHRWLAVLVTILVFFIFFKALKNRLTRYQKTAMRLLIIAIAVQFILGIYTILYSVPIVLGVLHQFGAMLFLISILTARYFFQKSNNVRLIA
jgi:cytochrome c oxidase assembly protein subunit 15